MWENRSAGERRADLEPRQQSALGIVGRCFIQQQSPRKVIFAVALEQILEKSSEERRQG
jgi:hypothetical protein